MSNKAQIVKKIVIQEHIVTLSPLRIASGNNDGKIDILVLKNKYGKSYIPGTSLAGVLRDELSSIYSEKLVDKFFGNTADDNTGNQSMISISDIVFKKSRIINRDGVAIDYITGVGIDGAKYDFEAVERGCEGQLKIEITVRNIDKNISVDEQTTVHDGVQDIYSDICSSIADILSSGISVGSLTTKGFGKIKSKKNAEVFEFDFAETEAAENWLLYLKNEKPVMKPMYVGSNDASIKTADDFYMQVDCLLHSSLLIKSEAEDDDKDSDGNKVKISAVQMKSKIDYVIPGTSIKGVFKNKAMKILSALNSDQGKAEKYLSGLMGCAKNNYSLKSRFYVDEVYISTKDLLEKKQSRNRIDRLTGSTIDSALFTEKPVWQQQKDLPIIRLNFRVKKCTADEAGLLLLLLKELWMGNIFVGSGKSIGRGILIGKYCEIDYLHEHYVIDETMQFSISGDKQKLESYVQALVGELNG